MRLQHKKVIALVDHDFEDLELWYPFYRLQEEGAQVDLIGSKAGKTYFGKHGVPATTDAAFSDIESKIYDAILVPGGWAPDKLRRYPEVLAFIREMNEAKKPIGQICHAGWVLISANILDGKNVTSTPASKDEMTNAGAAWVDDAVLVDGPVASSRRPPELHDYDETSAALLAVHER